jgi:hypothetical protein
LRTPASSSATCSCRALGRDIPGARAARQRRRPTIEQWVLTPIEPARDPLCISPLTQKGKGGMQFYERWRDGGQFSPKACTPACTEALVTVECDLSSDSCDDTFALEVECYGGDFAAGFPKKVQ